MKKRAEELVGRMSQLVESTEDWHEVGEQDEPVFLNSWINFDNTRKARFYKTLDRVYLGGLIKSGTVGQIAFTLPEGYLPGYVDTTNQNLLFPCLSNNAFGIIRINNTGGVEPYIGNNTYFSLEGISFRIKT